MRRHENLTETGACPDHSNWFRQIFFSLLQHFHFILLQGEGPVPLECDATWRVNKYGAVYGAVHGAVCQWQVLKGGYLLKNAIMNVIRF